MAEDNGVKDGSTPEQPDVQKTPDGLLEQMKKNDEADKRTRKVLIGTVGALATVAAFTLGGVAVKASNEDASVHNEAASTEVSEGNNDDNAGDRGDKGGKASSSAATSTSESSTGSEGSGSQNGSGAGQQGGSAGQEPSHEGGSTGEGHGSNHGQTNGSESTSGRPDVYVIKDGDTLSSISGALGISLDRLVRYNEIVNPNMIYAGAALELPNR